MDSVHPTPTLLSIGVDEKLLDSLQDVLKSVNIHRTPFDLHQISIPIEPTPAIILVSLSDSKIALECAQVLRMVYPPHVGIFLCCGKKEAFERKDSIDYGFTDAFLLPIDLPTLRNTLVEFVSHLHAAPKAYRSVNMLDINEGETLDFDTSIFMPSNNKYMKVSVAGNEIDSHRLEKIRKNKITNLHVTLDQIQKFYDFSAKKLRKINSDGPVMNVTERREKLTHAVRDLMTGLFSSHNTSFETGQDVLKNCKGIVSSYIMQGPNADWYSRIQQVMGAFGDHYSHASNVSAFAALFSMGIGVGKAEDLALAGLLHDIGESNLPPEIQELEPEDMSKEQFEIYKKHPEYSAEIIRHKRMLVPEMVMKIILQHHEHFDGTGFPRGFIAEKFSNEAQVLCMADEFDRRTKTVPGKPAVLPLQAVQDMIAAQSGPGVKVKFNPELLVKLLTLFSVAPH